MTRDLAYPARVAQAPLVADLHPIVLDDLGIDKDVFLISLFALAGQVEDK